jgi:glutathione S-transferase
VLKGLAMLNARLSKTPFFGGEVFSVADITANITVDFMRVTKIAVPADMTALLDWRARMQAMPCFAFPAKR